MAENELGLNSEAPSPLLRRFYGFFCILACSFLSSIGSVVFKKMRVLDSFEILVIRFFLQIIAVALFMSYRKIKISGDKESRKLLLWRGLFGSMCIAFCYLAIKTIAPSDLTVLMYTNAIMVPLLARFVLKEKLTVSHLIALILTIIGVILIAQPQFIFKRLMY